jgi:tetratricopeptide (TPR) repeat protein
MRPCLRLVLLLPLFAAGAVRVAADADTLVKEALAAEARLDSRHALELFLAAVRERPDDAFIVQKIARQYSDLTLDLTDEGEKRRYAQSALEYSQRAVRLDPTNPVNVLSLAICHGKLALYGDTRTKIQYSRLVREEAQRALDLDPNYAWAHHVLGRWNYEVASLGPATRLVLRLVYGGLPDASCAAAIAHLARAVELEPDEPAHRLELGFAYLAAGERAKARAEFAKGLAMTSRAKQDESAKQRAREALTRLDS